MTHFETDPSTPDLSQNDPLPPSQSETPQDVIRVLSDSVINQIKAGEVVERPLSVVKELVENALDADATDVTVDLFDGGKTLIRVTDTGKGMSERDALLSVCRHATSKIQNVDDLDLIATFGFRGEALASIAAVSKFTLRTRRACDPVATQLQGDGAGATENFVVKPVPAPPGTVIEVSDLFCNTPARQKFLKSAATEYAHIHDFLQAMAFAYPSVSWTLTHNRRRVFGYRAARDLNARAQDILGEGFGEYYPVTFAKGSFGLSGFVGNPTLAKPMPQHFVLFVNGRLVRDKVIRSGVLQAYSGLVMKGLVPSVIVFVQCDPSWVDVNAHPSKIEVRFRDPLVVQDLVSLALVGELRSRVQRSAMPFAPVAAPSAFPLSSVSQSATDDQGKFGQRAESLGASKPLVGPGAFGGTSLASTARGLVSGSRFQEQAQRAGDRMDRGLAPLFSSAERASGASPSSPSLSGTFGGGTRQPLRVPSPLPQITEPVELLEVEASPRLRYLGQVNKLYLLFESEHPRELWVVDQHAFHERILFESLIKDHDKQEHMARQSFLTPLFVPLPAALGPLVAEHAATFRNLGFEVEWVEAMSRIAIHSAPAFLEVTKVERVFDEVLVRVLAALDSTFDGDHPLLAKLRMVRSEWSLEGRSFATLESKDLYHLVYATIACHAAVRAGQEIREEQAKFLIERASGIDFSAHCPHGRPVLRKLSVSEIASWFGRT